MIINEYNEPPQIRGPSLYFWRLSWGGSSIVVVVVTAASGCVAAIKLSDCSEFTKNFGLSQYLLIIDNSGTKPQNAHNTTTTTSATIITEWWGVAGL